MQSTGTFSQTLKGLVKAKQTSINEISRKTGIPNSTLSDWYNGRVPVLGEAVIKLARFFDVSVEFLISGQPPESTIIEGLLNHQGSEYTTIHQGVYRVQVEKLVNTKVKMKGETS